MLPYWFLIFIFLAIAIVLANYQLWIPAIVLSLGLIILGIYNPKYTRAFTAAMVLTAGILYFNFVTPTTPENLPMINQAELEGVIKNYPNCDGQKTDFIIACESDNPYTSLIRVYCNFPVNVQKGEKVSLKGSLKPPARAGNPGEFDYRKYLERNGIYYILSVKNEKDLQIKAPANSVQALMNSYRSRSQEIIKEVLPPDDASILVGMLLGIIEDIDGEEYSDYQKTGIVHIFSVSGLHVGFLLVLCTWICSLMGLSPKARMITGITLLLLYASLVGWPVPVVRSVIMGVLALIAYYSGRENQLLNSLGLAGIVLLLINPLSLMQITFQLSFAAAWGLVYLFPLLKQKLNYNSGLGDLLLVPLCAQIAILPLIAYHFNLFSPLSLLANIPVTYLSAGAVILGFITLATGLLLPGLSALFLYPAGLCVDLIRLVNQIVVGIPGAYLRVATPGLAIILLYYAGLFFIISTFYLTLSLGKKRLKLLMASGTGMMFIFIMVLCLPPSVYNRGLVELSFIDVGQGDSALLKTPQGKFILIDGGGSDFSDPGSRKVLPFLYHRGVRELFLAINTHPDNDHLLGMETVLKEMPVKYIAIPASLADDEGYQSLKEIAALKEVSIIPVAAGDRLNIGENIQLEVLHPTREYQADNVNDHSLVVEVRYGSFSALLTGDIGDKVMQELTEQGKIAPVTIVKIPHHGSKSSLNSSFYDKTNCKWGIISVGVNNLFGHPHLSIIKALEERNVNIFRTDRDGAVMFYSDGTKVKVITGLP